MPFSCAVTCWALFVFSLGTEAAGLFHRALPGFALSLCKHSIS